MRGSSLGTHGSAALRPVAPLVFGRGWSGWRSHCPMPAMRARASVSSLFTIGLLFVRKVDATVPSMRSTVRSRFGKRALVSLVVGVMLVASVASGHATTGDVDAGYGTNGYVIPPTQQLLATNAAIGPVAVPSTGGVEIGAYQAGLSELMRFTANGQLDAAWGNGGIVDVSAEPLFAVGPDSSTYYLGPSPGHTGPSGTSLTKLTPAGLADSSFGSAGTVETSHLGFFTYVQAPLIQDDGKVLVSACAGATTQDCTPMTARLLPTGELDRTWGTNGFASISPASWELDHHHRLVLLNEVAGPGGYIVQRFNTTGAPDNTFGTAGAATGNLSIGGRALWLALFPDDGVLVVGTVSVRGLDSHGSPQNAFNGGNEMLAVNPSQPEIVEGATVDPVGDVLVAVSIGLASNERTGSYVRRFNWAGQLDTHFASNGTATLSPPGLTGTWATGLAITGSTDVVVAGGAVQPESGLPNIFLAQLDNTVTPLVVLPEPTLRGLASALARKDRRLTVASIDALTGTFTVGACTSPLPVAAAGQYERAAAGLTYQATDGTTAGPLNPICQPDLVSVDGFG
jgi:uncharacterized delta-60 repeat protein